MISIFKRLESGDKNKAQPIHICRPSEWEHISAQLTPMQRTFAKARNFSGEAGQFVRVPDESGEVKLVLYGVGPAHKDDVGPVRVGQLAGRLPKGLYYFASLPEGWTSRLAATGWGMGAYKFDRYLSDVTEFPTLLLSGDTHPHETESLVASLHLGRDLINTPASDMGPVALHKAAVKLAEDYDATVKTIVGEELLAKNYPMIHAVGRAAHEAPRLVEFEWGNPDHPRLAIVGKGITFDTGGVNIKSASSARLMKKDMGGAAHTLALAKMIMANNLPIRLHVLVAIAENAVSAGAYRPGDVLSSRAGLSIEIDNTDAEGRLVLGDALTKASESDPALIMDFATLTGAARVALGPELAPFYCNRKGPVASLLEQSEAEYDPMWHMPLWRPYYSLLNSPLADMKNSGGGFAGSVTAGLFLQKFVADKPWMHFDVYGWWPTSAPGHPKGGEMFALRAIYFWLKSGGLEQDLSR